MGIGQIDSGAASERPSAAVSKKRKGKLRIYFGYAAGVGKTCAMLHDAQEARLDGVDVVAGYIEPHVRPETMALMEGMECLPPRQMDHKGISLREFDLDRALERKPELILVDELAHSNVAGCRHKKRYQDVDELLRAGIDVYTTVNVQHIESLHDLVASITGVSVRERIPDSVFDSADQIELVDIEPDDLIDRLNKGKIYREAQAKRALENFFTKQKLIALREIALRRTADQVTRAAIQNDAQGTADGENRPYGNEHILVCLSSAPSNAKVVRTAARMADALHGSLTALFVETPAMHESGEKNIAMLQDNLRLAEQLGAQIATVYGESIPEQIAEYAKVSRITKIVMGRSAHVKRWFVKSNFVDRLSELAPNLEIYIIPDTQPSRRSYMPQMLKPPRFSLIDVAKSLGMLALCTLVGHWIFMLGYNEANIITIYLLGVLINAVLTRGWGNSAIYSVLSVLAFNYFYTEPNYELKAYDPGYPVTFAVMLAAALIASTLTKSVKTQARQTAQKAYRTEVLLETNRKLEQAASQTEILSEMARQLIKLLDRTVIVYAVHQQTLEEPLVFLSGGAAYEEEYLRTEERAVAEWVQKNNKRAGATTNTLSAAKCLYLAVRSGNDVLAVVGIAMDVNRQMEPFEKSLMIAMLGECAMALEKLRADESSRQIAVEAQQERLRANLLRAISHDLRTPLTSISGNAGMLMNISGALSEAQKAELYSDIYDDAMWLNNLVENLLAITRIENDNVSLNMRPELLSEVIEEALSHVSQKGAEHHIEVSVSDDLLMARMDARLISQVIINMVDNAVKYTQAGSSIAISAVKEGKKVRVEVADDGPGISEEAKAKIFDMFYTANNASGDGRRGLGLGLYLCKVIVGAHGGEIYVKDNQPQGTVFGFTLEAQEVNCYE